MIVLRTEKQKQYFYEVMKLHFERGFGEDKIARILPLGHTTVSRWIAKFASEQAKTSGTMKQTEEKRPMSSVEKLEKELAEKDERIRHLEAQLRQESLRADAYDELINVAESMYHIRIRKKIGAKQ